MNLLLANKKRKYKIKTINVKGKILNRLEALGIIKGTKFEVLEKNNFGLILIKIRGTRIGLDENIALKIYVEEDYRNWMKLK